MKTKKLLSLVLALCTVFGLSASAFAGNELTEAKEIEATEVMITDMIGRELSVKPGSYKNVVCIGAGALRMYSYIGDVSLLCGVEDIDNTSLEKRPKMFDAAARPYVLAFGEIFKTLPSCGVGGPNAQAAEAEKIFSCSPDIVISEYEDTDKENALQEQLGVPVITLKASPSGVFCEEFMGSIRLLGKVFGEEEKAETLISFVESETAEITKRTAEIADADKPSVYICGLGSWGTANHLMTSENYSTFSVANIKNVVSGLGIKGIGEIEAEKFIVFGADMDIMFIDAAAIKNIQPLYAEDNTMFDTCKAWQNGEVYLQMAYNAYYTNYEIALANAWFLAKTVYPESFDDIDMTDKLNEITNTFLGKELASEIFACGNSFGGYQKIDTAAFFS
ncbi:MAG: ABC transporter substrate-binding protein [Eubacteriales bacterium]|nr:ABC transporter substrate-binding protein [Eubacteriales bacterium]